MPSFWDYIERQSLGPGGNPPPREPIGELFDKQRGLSRSSGVATYGGAEVGIGEDVDLDLITVAVTGSPKLQWDESESAFALTAHLLPGADNTYDLGSATFRWRDVRTVSLTATTLGAERFLATTAGSAGAPSFSWTSDPDTGLYNGTNTLYVSVAGSQHSYFDPSFLHTTAALRVSRDAGGLIVLRDSGSVSLADLLSYVSLRGSDDIEQGYIGYGSVSNTNLTISNSIGLIDLLSNASGVYFSPGGVTKAYISSTEFYTNHSVQINSSLDQQLFLAHQSATGSPYLSLYQQGNRRAYFQYTHTDGVRIVNEGSETMRFYVNPGVVTNRMNLYSSYLELIGSSSDEQMRIVHGSGTGNPYISFYQAANRRFYLQYDSSGYTTMGFDSGGYLRTVTSNDLHLALEHTSATGSPYISWVRAGTRRAYIQYFNAGDIFLIYGEAGGVQIRSTGTGATDNFTVTNASSNDMLQRLDHWSATGNPTLGFTQAGTLRSQVRHLDSGDELQIQDLYGNVGIYPGSAGTAALELLVVPGQTRLASVGSAGTPSLAWNTDTNTGLYNTADQINFSTGGSQRAYLSNDRLNLTSGVGLVVGGGTRIAQILSATVVWDIPSTAAHTFMGSTTVTVTGAATGDMALVMEADSSGITGDYVLLHAWVSAANTVTITAFNADNVTNDPASRTLRVIVFKF